MIELTLCLPRPSLTVPLNYLVARLESTSTVPAKRKQVGALTANPAKVQVPVSQSAQW